MQKEYLEMIDWDKRYREGFYDHLTQPHELLIRFYPLIKGKVVIDIAMGNGRDAIFLAEKGFKVLGIERSAEAIKIAKKASEEKGCKIFILLADAEELPLKKEVADCIIIFYFLSRKIVKELPKILKKDGILIHETYLKRQNLFDRWRDPEHLLEDGELLDLYNNLEPLFYEEITIRKDGGKKVIARFVGRKE